MSRFLSKMLFSATLKDFPPKLRKIAEVIGVQATQDLIEEFNGEFLYIPAKPIWKHRIHQAIGIQAFEKLCDSFGTSTVKISRCVAMRKRLHYTKEIQKEYKFSNGRINNARVARKLGISSSYVYHLTRQITDYDAA